MKVLLVANYLPSRQQSMQRYSSLLEQGLSAAGCDVRLTTPPAIIGRLASSPNGMGKWLGYVDRFLIFPPTLSSLIGWADVVHICDQSNAGYVYWVSRKPTLVTCHDVLAIRASRGDISEHRPRWSGRVLHNWTLSGLKRAGHIVCVSEQTRADLLGVLAAPNERVSVVPNAITYSYERMTLAKALSICRNVGVSVDNPFLLHVGADVWYKNRAGLLRIFCALLRQPKFRAHRLVLVGPPLSSPMRRQAENSGIANMVHTVDNVSDEVLCALYSAAKALLVPSFQEGFGWPIIEAQACGCPVFATNRAPMTEVGGKAAIYFDPNDPRGAARIIADSIENSKMDLALGYDNARRFSLENMIAGYCEVYDRLIHQPSSGP